MLIMSFLKERAGLSEYISFSELQSQAEVDHPHAQKLASGPANKKIRPKSFSRPGWKVKMDITGSGLCFISTKHYGLSLGS